MPGPCSATPIRRSLAPWRSLKPSPTKKKQWTKRSGPVVRRAETVTLPSVEAPACKPLCSGSAVRSPESPASGTRRITPSGSARAEEERKVARSRRTHSAAAIGRRGGAPLRFRTRESPWDIRAKALTIRDRAARRGAAEGNSVHVAEVAKLTGVELENHLVQPKP